MDGVPGAELQLPLFSNDSIGTLLPPGELPEFGVRISVRARHMWIKVFPEGRIEVVVPRRTRPAAIDAFVSENREWIAHSLAKLAAEYVPKPSALPSKIHLPAINRNVFVDYQAVESMGTVRYRERGDAVILIGGVRDKTLCVKALRRWLSKVAKRELVPKLCELSMELSLPYERTCIRLQRTRWGSRSSSGTISLNLCLLFLQPKLVRYLMIHELCHGRHMNHSRRFWNLLATFQKNYRRLDRELGASWHAVPGWLDSRRASG